LVQARQIINGNAMVEFVQHIVAGCRRGNKRLRATENSQLILKITAQPMAIFDDVLDVVL
jgi:hypothetical protein